MILTSLEIQPNQLQQNKIVKELINQYLKFFSSKDIEMLKEMFSDNIILKDWEINAIGITQVIDANMKIFNSVESINVTLIEYFEDKKNCICLLEVSINNKEIINVIDVIRFDNHNKIKEISAYKQ